MDRIRDAVARARSAQPPKRAAAPTGTASRRPVVTGGAGVVACDTERFAAHRIVASDGDPAAAAYRILRTKVLQRARQEGWKTIAVVSPSPGAGKTLTAINLAIAIGAQQGGDCALIDFDFYRPSVASYLGLANPPSVVEYFEGAKSIDDVVIRTDLANVLVVANDRVSRRGAEFFASPAADELLSACVNRLGAQTVIIDLPPLIGCDDTLALLPKVDCALLVVASGETRVSDLNEARRLLGKTPVIGSTLNKARATFGAPNYYYAPGVK